jgi:hypothetical protein
MSSPKPTFYVKNINDTYVINGKRKSKGDSYMNEPNPFPLHFLREHKTNAENLSKGDIILLFQKDKNEKRIFTHIVTPIDDNTTFNPSHLFQGNPNTAVYERRVEIIEIRKQNPIFASLTKFWQDVSFRGISFGNACEIKSISAVKNGSVSLKDLINEMWNIFNVNQNKRSFP